MSTREGSRFSSITRLFASAWDPPIAEDVEMTEKRRALSVILWNMLGICVFILVYNEIDPTIGPYDRVLQGMGALFVLIVGMHLLNVRGKTKAASVLLVAGQVAIVTWLVLNASGMNDLVQFWYLPVIFTAGLLLGGRAGFVAALLCILLLLGIVFLESAGVLPASLGPPPPFAKFRVFIELVVTISVIQYLSSRIVRNVLRKTQEELRERIRAEKALQAEAKRRQESELKSQAILDNAYAFVGMLSPEGILLEANKSALTFAGVPAESVIGKRFWETPWWGHSPELQEKVRKAVEQAAAGEMVRFEATHLSPENVLHTVDFSLNPVRDASGRVVYLIPEGQDVTDRTKAEESMRQSEVRYRTLFETAGDAIFLMEENRFIACNRRTLEVFRCTREQILGRTPIEFSPPVQPDGRASDEKAREKIEQTFRGQPQFFEWRHTRQDGSQFDAEVSLNRVEFGSGNLMQAIVRDVTERKRADEQLKSSLKEKEILLKEVHHRVRNNMQVITSLLSLQAGGINDKAMKEMFLDSQNRIRSMALIHELLYFSQIYGSVDFLEYCRKLVDRLQISYRTRNVGLEILGDSFSLDLDQAVPCGLILNELVSNALKHAFPSERPGNVRIEIRREGKECRFSVSDDGVGMQKSESPAEPQTLGMRLIANLTDQIGGTFNLLSPPGTRCTVTFPITAGDTAG